MVNKNYSRSYQAMKPTGLAVNRVEEMKGGCFWGFFLKKFYCSIVDLKC